MQRESRAPGGMMGGHHLGEVLGTGGMGIVYRAVDAEGRSVALKTAKTRRARDVMSLRGEISRLRRVTHRGIVGVFADGSEGGVPWYTMELLEGGSLADRIARARSPRSDVRPHEPRDLSSETLDELPADVGSSRDEPAGAAARAHPDLAWALRIGVQLADTLAFLHGQGIVHRDIKPANILLRADGSPVLLDFGVALETRMATPGSPRRENLEVAGRRQGTMGYAAPEQILGEFLDGRSDLYSLGCVLFELVTGDPVFEAASREGLLDKHLHEVPRRVSALVSDVPVQLDDLIAALLTKTRRDRVPRAEIALDVLNALVAPETAPTMVSPTLFRPELSGREAVVQALDEQVAALEAGRGALVMVDGESGVGKTFLVNEVCRRARSRGLDVVTAECIAVEASTGGGAAARGGALHPFREFLRTVADHCVEGSPALLAAVANGNGRVLATYEPRLLELAEVASQAAIEDVHPDAIRERTIGALQSALGAFAQIRPLVLVVDDLQWADETTLSFLTSLTPGYLEASPVLVVTTCRSEERSAAVDALCAATDMRQISLERLDAPAVTHMLEAMLGSDSLPEGLAAALDHHAEGNPLFVAEYVRSVVELGLLERRDGRWTAHFSGGTESTLNLPGSLREVIGARLERLSEPARRLVDVAAVIGREIDAEVAAEVAALGDLAPAAFSELAAKQFLEVNASGHLAHHRFLHDKLREATYAALSDEQRRDLHAKIGSALERAGVETASVEALAHHFGQAGDEAREAKYRARAGLEAHARGAHREALPQLRRALAVQERLGASALELARLRYALGLAHEFVKDNSIALGLYEAALVDLGHALPYVGSGGAASLLKHLSEQVARRVSRGRWRAPETEHAKLLLASEIAIRMSTTMLFDPALAQGVFTACLASANYADRAGGTSLHATGVLGWAAGGVGRSETARRYFRELPRTARGAARVGLAQARLFEASFMVSRGEAAAAIDTAEACWREYEALGDPWSASAAALIIGVVHYGAGRLPEAFDCFKRAGDLAIPVDPRHRGMYHPFAALVALATGASDVAESLLAECWREFDTLPPLSRANCHAVNAKLAAWRGDPHTANQELQSLLAISSTPGTASVNGLLLFGCSAEAALFGWARPERGLRAVASAARSHAHVFKLHALTRLWLVGYPVGSSEALLQEGELLLRLGADRRAETVLRRAVTVAARMRLPLLEARARAALASLPRLDRAEAEDLRACARSMFLDVGAGGYVAAMSPG